MPPIGCAQISRDCALPRRLPRRRQDLRSITHTINAALALLILQIARSSLVSSAPRGYMSLLTFYVASGTAVGTPVYTTAERLVTSEEISRSSLKLAIIAIEDERFLTRYIGPVDVIALARAMMMNLLGKRQGGSTLRLQIAKALSGKLRSSYSDKPGHSFIALRLDQRYSNPDDLLAIYSNLCEIYGDQSGMAQAAFRMFDKTSLTQLSIAESALLAGMLKSPAKYNPRSHPQEAKQRRDIVLGKMRELDMISEGEYRRAISESINLKPQRNGYEMIARAALAV